MMKTMGIGLQMVIVVLLFVRNTGARYINLPPTCDVKNPSEDGQLSYLNNTDWNSLELVVENQARRLFCNVNNFCDLRWYDSVTREPIEEDRIIKFQDNNQTLVISPARLSDQRNYSCEASQGETKLTPRNYTLYVLDEQTSVVSVGQPSYPYTTSCHNTTAENGETVTFFCLYTTTKFTVMTPGWKLQNETDQYNYVNYLNEMNKNKPEVSTFFEATVYYDPNNLHTIKFYDESDEYFIYNSTLIVHNISDDAFGSYEFAVSLEGDIRDHIILSLSPVPEPAHKIDTESFIVIAVVLAFIVSIAFLSILIYRRNSTELRDNFDCLNKDIDVSGNVPSDVYISYSHITSGESAEDLNFAVDVLKKELEGNGYSVLIRDIDHLPGTSMPEEILDSLKNSRCCILVISPDYLNSWVTQYDMNQMMDRVQDPKRQIIPIIFRDISGVQEQNSHRLLKHIMEIVKCLRWPEGSSNDKKLTKKRTTFLKELRLRLPRVRSQMSRASVCTNASLAELTSRVEAISETTPPSRNPSISNPDVPSVYPTLGSMDSNTHEERTSTVA